MNGDNMDGEQPRKPMTNAERQKRYREKKRNDSTFKQKDNIRSRKNYHIRKSAHPDEVREKARIRKQRSRDHARIDKKKGKISLQVLGKMAKKVANLLPNSPSSKRNLLKRVGKMHGIDIVNSKQIKVVISESDKKTIKDFYENNDISRIDPTFKNAKTSQVQIKLRRHLLFTVSEAFSLFKESHPEIKVGRSTFANLRPDNVKSYRDIPQNVCMCKYHENFEKLVLSLGHALESFPKPVQELVNVTRCDTTKYECMASKCGKCNQALDQILDLTRYGEKVNTDIKYVQWLFVNRHFKQVTIETKIQ